ncbi:putative receptor-like protein kinase [Carex littledalei]|uniref:Putative receptor-like protein kinase n=1 Tax=Carex littledalei TaxID=544730 RepID=A0A833Q7H6_9POAL|nr:putative receptor-like protein kinase [Carex littledalei]
MKFPDLNLALLSALLLIFLGSPAADAADVLYQICGTTGNYTANSTYDLNLQTLLTNLTTSATNSSSNFGFAKSTVGSVPNQIFGLVLCRGDVNSSNCSSCLSQATQDIQNLCPYYKEATIYYDFCLLRFSNQNFLSSTDNTNQVYMWNTQNVTGSKTLYSNYVRYLMNTTADYAAFNRSKKFATGQLNLSQAFPETYGLVQCTPDMSTSDCASCLNSLIDEMLKRFSGRQGARILGVRCNIRYEIYSFYSSVSLLSLTPPVENAPAPAPAMTPPVMNPGPQGMERTIYFTCASITS